MNATLAQIRACIRVNLKYAWRNRLLLICALILVGLTALGLIPFLFGLFQTASKKFDIVLLLFQRAASFIYMMVALLGVMGLSQEMQNRSMKLIVTRPCRFETWLAGQYLTAACIVLFCHAALVSVTSLLFLGWGIPNIPGLFIVSLAACCQALIIFSWLMLLTAVLHPIVAVILSLVVQEGLFYHLLTMTLAGIEVARKAEHLKLTLGLQGLERLLRATYLFLPSYAPLEEKLRPVSANLRATPEAWAALGGVALYTAVFLAFSFFTTSWILRGRRHT